MNLKIKKKFLSKISEKKKTNRFKSFRKGERHGRLTRGIRCGNRGEEREQMKDNKGGKNALH